MVGAERKNFLTLKSLVRRKWHFQTLVWPSAGCRAQSTISQNYGGVALLHIPRNVHPRLRYAVGIITFAMRKRTLDGAWVQSSVFQHIRQTVNLLPLEEIGDNTTPSITQKNNERDKTAQMIEHIILLENRLKDEPKTYTNF